MTTAGPPALRGLVLSQRDKTHHLVPATFNRTPAHLRGWDAVEIEGRRNNGPWELLAVCLKRKYTDLRPPLVPGQPEVREYRLRYRLGDQPQEGYD